MFKKNHWPFPLLILLALAGVGGFLRFRHLAYPSMMADVMEFYKLAAAGISPWELIKNPTSYGAVGLWAAAHNLFLALFSLDVTFHNLRILDALTGTVSILALYLFAARVGGPWTGIIAAAFLALHPVHIQMSRESYSYVAIFFGVICTLYALFYFQDIAAQKKRPGAVFYVAALIGFALTTMSVASWPFAGIAFGTLLILMLRAGIQRHVDWRWVILLLAGFGVFAIPLFWSGNIQWALDQIFRVEGDEANAAFWREIFGEKEPGRFLRESLFYMQGYLFGAGWMRSSFNVAVMGLGLYGFFAESRANPQGVLFCSLFAGAATLLALSVYRADQILDMRHYTPLFPFLAVWVGLSFKGVSMMLGRFRAGAVQDRWLAAAYVVVLAALFLRPALWAAKAEGHQPYLRIADWVDEHLEPGTVVQVDRWLTPWNELRVNASTHPHFTFLFPNAPPGVYQDSRYREQLMAYFRDHPQAAFLEQKHYWDRISPWREPHELFARKQVFLDEATHRLNQIGLAYRGRPGLRVPQEDVEITLYYNRTEDLLERARQRGEPAVVLMGPEWGYAKPWSPPAQWPEQLVQLLWLQAGWAATHGEPAPALDRFNQLPEPVAMQYLNLGRWMDYRIPPARGEVQIVNLTDKMVDAVLHVTAISIGGRARVAFGNQQHVYEPNLFAQKPFPVQLQPGENRIRIGVPPNQLILVSRMDLRE